MAPGRTEHAWNVLPHLTLTLRVQRLREAVELGPKMHMTQNALGVALEEFYFYDGESYWTLPSRLASGQKQDLNGMGALRLSSLMGSEFGKPMMHLLSENRLRAKTWLGRSSESPFVEDDGLNIQYSHQENWIYGVESQFYGMESQ